MPRTSWSAVAAPVPRPRGRPRKVASSPARFAPIHLADVAARPDPAAMVSAIELHFPDGLTLRATRDADPIALELFLSRLRRRLD